MANILIFIGGHLCNAPRPQKEAETLTRAGHIVTVQGAWFDLEFMRRDQQLIVNKPYCFQPYLDFQSDYRLRNWQVRSQARLTRERWHHFHQFSPARLGYGN